jgi:aryl-alcohol dehydrogenase-like predicted oxidoreductase
MQAVWDAGVRYFDTAPWYGSGLSEHRLGGLLRTKPRDQFLITTKVGRQFARPKDPKTFDRSNPSVRRKKVHAGEKKPPVIIGRDDGGHGHRDEMPCTPPARPLHTAP